MQRHPGQRDRPRAGRDADSRRRTGRLDATTAHDDDPAGLNGLPVEDAIGDERDGRRGILRNERNTGGDKPEQAERAAR